MTPVESFLSHFDLVKPSGGQFLVRCPAHQDKNPSLAVKEGSAGEVLLKDHGGCSVDAILAALNLDASALFEAPTNGSSKRQVVATYDYRNEAGELLFQAVRYSPKAFSQRAPDGTGGWIYSLKDVRRVVYKLPELKGQKAIILCEGEKDADKAWTMQIPATTSPMGAGKWDPSYAQQIHAAGVLRVAIIPDNDEVGAAHASNVCASLQAVGIEVRLIPLPGVPEHGDLCDWVAAGGTKQRLVEMMRNAPIAPVAPPTAAPLPRQFLELGEGKYALDIHPEGVRIQVDRLRRNSHELNGELLVRVNGHFEHARTFQDGILSVGDLNFSSVQARSSRAKVLVERSGDKGFDWFGCLEEFITKVIVAERRGEPARVLADVEVIEEVSDTWEVLGFPLLRQLPTVLFGDSASGKSYFAMYLAGQLASDGVPVLYVDWEFSESEHKRRLQRLFQPMPRSLHYLRCDRSIRHELDHLTEIITKYKIQYLICDSVGFAVEGPAESQEGASAYFRYLRQLRVGSLSIAHIPKQREDDKEAQIFGSIFFKHGARSVWFIDRVKDITTPGELHFGLFHRKNNMGATMAPKGYKLLFTGDRTAVEAIEMESLEELSSNLPMIQRVKKVLEDGPMSTKRIAEDLASTTNVVRAVISKHKSQFIRVGEKVALFRKDDSIGF